MSDRSDARQLYRAPVSLEVHYRTEGSFLVSYSLNLSKGGLFLETPSLLPVGSHLTVRFTIPGAAVPVETTAVVMWVRDRVSAEGLPLGLGLRFERLEEHLGALIDGLVQHFQGVRLMVLANDAASQDRIVRNLRTILSADLIRATAATILIEGFASRADLILVDLDSTGSDGLAVIERATTTLSPPLPVVALTRDPRLRDAAVQAGAQSVVENPPPYEVLRHCVLDVLGKPCAGA